MKRCKIDAWFAPPAPMQSDTLRPILDHISLATMHIEMGPAVALTIGHGGARFQELGHREISMIRNKGDEPGDRQRKRYHTSNPPCMFTEFPSLECVFSYDREQRREIQLRHHLKDLVTYEYKATLLEAFGIDVDSDPARGFECMPLFSE